MLSGFLNLKTTEWLTISRLGFESETPAGYLQKPSLYHNTCMILFLIAILVPFFYKSVPLWGVILVVIEWFFVSIKGRESAIKIYRNIIQEMVTEPPDKADDILKKTDTEIWNELIAREKLIKGIHK